MCCVFTQREAEGDKARVKTAGGGRTEAWMEANWKNTAWLKTRERKCF